MQSRAERVAFCITVAPQNARRMHRREPAGRGREVRLPRLLPIILLLLLIPYRTRGVARVAVAGAHTTNGGWLIYTWKPKPAMQLLYWSMVDLQSADGSPALENSMHSSRFVFSSLHTQQGCRGRQWLAPIVADGAGRRAGGCWYLGLGGGLSLCDGGLGAERGCHGLSAKQELFSGSEGGP